MSTPTLFGLEVSAYTQTARLALEEKNVDYVLEEIDIFAAGGPPTHYLNNHPFGKVPCLLHGDYCLYETGAITRYVDESFPGPSLQPAVAALRGRMNQIISVLDAYAYRPMVWDVYVQRIAIPARGGLADEGVISAALDRINIVLGELDGWLRANEFLAGSALSLADLHAYPMLSYFARTPEAAAIHESHPFLGRWFDCMKERASVKAVIDRPVAAVRQR